VLPLAFLAKYPFLPGAGDYIAAHGPSLEELLQDRAYGRARARGVDRVRQAVEQAEVEAVPIASESEALLELLSYGIGRMVVAGMGLPFAARRSAMAEAKLTHARLVRDLEEDEGVPRQVAGLLGMRLDEGGAVHVADYLRHAVPLKESGWKLVNQPLRKGFVELDATRLARLCQEAVRQRIEAAAQQEPPEEALVALGPDIAALRKAAEDMAAQFQGGDLGPVRLELLPPCMAKLLGQLQQGVNVAHTGRFAVTSFLHTIGMDTEAIMRLFAQAPDFKEEMTRYQVEHITGKSSGTEYTPPGCGSLVTYGHCPMEELPQDQRDRYCVHPKMHHPLTYYRWKVFRAEQREGKAPPPAAAAPGKEREEPTAARPGPSPPAER
jgi:DNA primase large subunit